MKRILLTGGGSGGHIYPLLAVAEKLTGHTVRYFGPHDIWHKQVVRAGIPTSHIAKAKMRRYFSLIYILDTIKLAWSFAQALIKVGLFRPDVAFSKGGPSALPVLFACKLYGVPIIIHESDSVPGITSRITGKWATILEVAWDEVCTFFPHANVRRVGIPLRTDITTTSLSKKEARTAMTCSSNLPVLLIIGGSQGSERINTFVLENLKELLAQYEIIHQIGSVHHKKYMRLYEARKTTLPAEYEGRYHPHAYLENTLQAAYSAADCAISRGGSVIFELAHFGIPAVLIPLPEAAHDHQRINAYAYAKKGAGVVIEENALNANTVLQKLETIMTETMHANMIAAGHAFAPNDAAERIANDILSL